MPQSLHPLFNHSHFENLLARWPQLGIHVEKALDKGTEISRIMRRDLRVNALEHLFIETFHISGSKRGLQAAHFVENAAKGPDVAFAVVGLISPNLWRSVIRRSSLCVKHPSFGDFGYVQVPKLSRAILVKKNIGRL